MDWRASLIRAALIPLSLLALAGCATPDGPTWGQHSAPPPPAPEGLMPHR